MFEFAEGSKDMRELLGGKGANVAEMTRVLGPDRVPAGFTISTEACVAYMRAGGSEPVVSILGGRSCPGVVEIDPFAVVVAAFAFVGLRFFHWHVVPVILTSALAGLVVKGLL